MKTQPLYLAGRWTETDKTLSVQSPFDGTDVAVVAQAGKKDIDAAIAAAEKALEQTRALEPYQSRDILNAIAQGIEERAEEFAQTLTKENGKTIKESRAEVARAVSTFAYAAAEAWRVQGEAYDAGITPAAKDRRILVRKFPVGVVAGIAPFNFPLNLTAHKIAPAIAAGCPIVIKPASKTPLSALLLAQIIEKTSWPKEAFSCLPCDREAGQMLVEDDRIKLLSFTGSDAVGWKLKEKAGKKKVVLELGGNAALIIDKGDHDWNAMIPRVVLGAFYQSGQSCISVQRIYCHADVYDAFKQRFVEAVQKLKTGDPMDEQTDLGPIIDAENAKRVQEWIAEAVEHGATVLTGNTAKGTLLAPTVLEGVRDSDKVSCQEAFGPVVLLERVKDVPEAVAKANRSRYGLQCGIYSNDFRMIQYAFNTLDVGGLVVGDTPSFRVDQMPYGGIKDSGLGREGIVYAMRDMQEEKVMVYFSRFTP